MSAWFGAALMEGRSGEGGTKLEVFLSRILQMLHGLKMAH